MPTFQDPQNWGHTIDAAHTPVTQTSGSAADRASKVDFGPRLSNEDIQAVIVTIGAGRAGGCGACRLPERGDGPDLAAKNHM